MWLSELSICDSPSQRGGVPKEREGPGPGWTALSLFFSLFYPFPGFHRKETFQLHTAAGRMLPASAAGECVHGQLAEPSQCTESTGPAPGSQVEKLRPREAWELPHQHFC